MRTRRLGLHGPDVSVVGFGAWALGGSWDYGWGSQDDGESIAAIRRAIESGVNWVDTAAAYGFGHSEEVVGEAVRPFRVGEEVLVFTKCGERWRESDDGARTQFLDLRAASIREECEQSLRRLGVDRIDLYQLHAPDTIGTPVEESWSTMAELVDEGKVRWVGVSNFELGLLERCEAIRHVDSLQPALNLLDPSARDELIPWCREHDTGVIVYSPMASGLLAGAFSRGRVEQLAPDDWRRADSRFQEPGLSRTLELVEELRAIAVRLGCPLPALVVAWALSVPGVTGAIVGARTTAQVDEWLPAGELELPAEVMAELEALTP